MFDEATVKEGDRVSYCGERYQVYKAEDLTVLRIQGMYATCIRPDGGYSTWLPVTDLVLKQSTSV